MEDLSGRGPCRNKPMRYDAPPFRLVRANVTREQSIYGLSFEEVPELALTDAREMPRYKAGLLVTTTEV